MVASSNVCEFHAFLDLRALVGGNIYIAHKGELKPLEFAKFNGHEYDPVAEFAKNQGSENNGSFSI